MGLFALPFGIAETAGNGFAADHHTRVRREHQIGQPSNGRHPLEHRAHFVLQHVQQPTPLSDSGLWIYAVDFTHPWIDFVVDAEIVGRTHQQSTHEWAPSSRATSRKNDAASITSPTA